MAVPGGFKPHRRGIKCAPSLRMTHTAVQPIASPHLVNPKAGKKGGEATLNHRVTKPTQKNKLSVKSLPCDFSLFPISVTWTPWDREASM